MTIREATPADAPIVTELVRRFLAGSIYGTLFGFDPSKLTELLLLILESGRGIVFLAYAGDRRTGGDGRDPDPPVAMLAAFLAPHEIDGQLCAQELAWWVNEEYRGHRVGPLLLGRFEDWATTSGATLLKLVAPEGSPKVRQFYDRLGYRPVETAYIKRV